MKGVEKQLDGMTNWNDAVGEYMKFQFQDMKRELVKELMIELIRADLNLAELDPSFQHFIAYLSKQPKREKVSPEIKSGLHEVERLVANA